MALLVPKILYENGEIRIDWSIRVATYLGNVTDEHPSAQSPSRVKGVGKYAVSEAYAMSNKAIMVAPIPIAGPLTIAIKSFGKRMKAWTIVVRG